MILWGHEHCQDLHADPISRLCGFMLTDIQQAEGTDDDGRKIHSDVFLITAGAAAA